MSAPSNTISTTIQDPYSIPAGVASLLSPVTNTNLVNAGVWTSEVVPQLSYDGSLPIPGALAKQWTYLGPGTVTLTSFSAGGFVCTPTATSGTGITNINLGIAGSSVASVQYLGISPDVTILNTTTNKVTVTPTIAGDTINGATNAVSVGNTTTAFVKLTLTPLKTGGWSLC